MLGALSYCSPESKNDLPPIITNSYKKEPHRLDMKVTEDERTGGRSEWHYTILQTEEDDLERAKVVEEVLLKLRRKDESKNERRDNE